MRLVLASPFLPPFFEGDLMERKTVLAILQESGDLAWCEEFVAVRLNGITVPRAWWPYVTVKPEAAGTLELYIVPQKGQLLPILASVALVALTAGIAAGGIATAFGLSATGTWGAGGLAASNFGAGPAVCDFGIANLFALNVLTEQ